MTHQFIPGVEPKWYRCITLNIKQNKLFKGYWWKVDSADTAKHIDRMILDWQHEPFWDVEISYSEEMPDV